MALGSLSLDCFVLYACSFQIFLVVCLSVSGDGVNVGQSGLEHTL